MSYVSISSSDMEQVLYRFNLSWWVQVWSIVIHVLIFLALLIPSMGLSVFVFVFTFWDLLDRWFTEYVITNRRLVYRRGIVRRVTREFDLRSIESVDLQQSVLGRLLGYGTIIVRGRGQSEIVFGRVGGAISVRRALQTAVDSR